jgi:type IV pilus assembly protein PilB
MSSDLNRPEIGDELVKQDIITREDLEKARAQESRSGTPWYKQLLQMQKVTFDTIENVLRYEFHSKSSRSEHQTLGDLLLAGGHITEAALEEALEEQKRSGRLLGNILLDGDYVNREIIGRVLSGQYGMEYSDVRKTASARDALEAVGEHMARKHNMIPVSLEGDRLSVLVVSPQNQLNDVAVLLGKRIHTMLTAVEDVEAEIRKRYQALSGSDAESVLPGGDVKGEKKKAPAKKGRGKKSEKKAVKNESEAVEAEEEEQEIQDNVRFEDIARQASGSSVINMVSTILEGAVNSGATDIHLDPQDPEMRVRFRIDGVLHDVMSIPEQIEAAVVSRIKIIADLDITETRHPQDGHISMEIDDREFDVRVATLPTFLGERVVLRMLDQASILSGISDLGLEKEDEKTFGGLIREAYGMILVTGPTGSGKTTTLYAALNQINVMTDSIVTLEDPVEYQISGINQVQIDPDIGVTFASVLRAALRQDIDVLLVGEIRDMETARIAIRAAMTGHLVFSTLHTNDAPEAISTLRNMGVPSYLISSALTGIIGQRLVRTICSNCKAGFKPSAALLKSVGLPANTSKLYRGKGCEECYNTGNRGRTGIFEVLEVTPQVRGMISEEKSSEEITKSSKLKTMAMRCRQKVKQGEVTPEEFLRVIRT